MKFIVSLNNVEHEIRFTARSICKLENELGYSVLSNEFLADRRLERVVKTLWAGLLHQQPTLTVDGVMDMLDAQGDIINIVPVLNKAFQYFWGISSDAEAVSEAAQEKKTEAQ